jgi:hypothetical protein
MMTTTLMPYDLRLLPERVTALKQLARRLSYVSQKDVGWTDLVRRGIDMVLVAEGEAVPEPAVNKSQTKEAKV